MFGALFLLLLDHALTAFKKWTMAKSALSPFRFDLPILPNCYAYYETKSDLRFHPQVYYQRYLFVTQILNLKRPLGGIQKVIDFGCAELGFFLQARNIEGIENYIAVDIDRDLLDRAASRTTPLMNEYLMKPRTVPFKVQLMVGSVADPDVSLRDPQVVIAIELIEHLFPGDLEALPYNIFGVLQPEIAVFTTPNSEFNVVFPNFKGFRHDDHKFEWTRDQFESWANNLVVRYPNYEVAFAGIGPGPPEFGDVGCCSQLAIFFRKSDRVDKSNEYESFYQLLREVDYPFETREQKRLNLIARTSYTLIRQKEQSEEYENEDRVEIRIAEILDFVRSECECTEEELRDILAPNYTIETLPDGTSGIVLTPYDNLSFEDQSVSSQPELIENQDMIEECWDVDRSEPHASGSGGNALNLSCSKDGFHSWETVETQRDKDVPELGLRLEDSQSRAVDSGYPNSVGEDMELDLTPEQVEEIKTETDSSFDDESEDDQMLPPANLAVVLDNVENGDVANNNRDGEGNNMEVDEVVEMVLVDEIEDEGAVGGGSDDEGLSVVDTSSQADSSHALPEPLPRPSRLHFPMFHDESYFMVYFQRPFDSSEERFPEWLLNVLVDEVGDDGHGGGDAGESMDQNAEPEGEDGSDTDQDPNGSIEGESSELSIEHIVKGDVQGGGDPPL